MDLSGSVSDAGQVFLALHGHLNFYTKTSMLGHSPVDFEDQHMVTYYDKG